MAPAIGWILSANEIRLVTPAIISDTRQTVINPATITIIFRALEFWTATSALIVMVSTVHSQQLASIESWTTGKVLRNSYSRHRPSRAKLKVMKIFPSVLATLFLASFAGLLPHALRADEKPMMKAVVAHEYGAPEVLKFEQVQRPEPNDDEALVRVIASSVNPADPLTLSGKYAKEFGTHLPLIAGYDIAGVVEKTGP